MSSWASIAGSWGCFAGVIILGWYYYTREGGPPKRLGRRKSIGTIEEVLKEVAVAVPAEQKKSKAKKKSQKNHTADDNDLNGKGKASNNTSTKKSGNATDAAKSSAIEVKTDSGKGASQEADVNAKEFAQRMAKAQAGTTFSGAKKDSQRIRTQKQSKANGILDAPSANGQEFISETSSHADADDDLSSVNSVPNTNAPTANGPSGVADMLEATGPGPSTLRITEPLFTKVPQKHAKKEQVVETKKQRQKRLKREQEKAVNQEAETQRRAQEEKQRRTAREAEGRPAKNGGGWTYASGLPANAWSSGNGQIKPTPTVNGPLLDTTEKPAQGSAQLENTPTTAVKKPQGANGTHGGNSSSSEVMAKWESDLPSEEEQYRLIQEQSEESEWTTVSQPKRSKRKDNATEDAPKKAPNGKQQSLFPAGFQTDVMD